MSDKEVVAYQEQPERHFNPNEHIIQIPNKGGKTDYLPVQWRLVWFRTLCPHGTIETELVHLDLDRETEEETSVWNQETRRSEKIMKRAQGIAIFKAVVTDGKGGKAEAYKSEKAASFGDFIEKANTGAVGRALAMLGYGTQFAEMELSEEDRIVDAPVERKPKAAEARAYTERKPFVEGNVVKNAKPETSGITLEAVQKRAVSVGIAQTRTEWQLFNAEIFGSFVPDEKLRNDQEKLVQLNEEISRRAAGFSPAA